MVQFEQRVVRLEGRVEGHHRMVTDVVGAVRHLEARMDKGFASVDMRFNSLEGRLTALDYKVDQKISSLDRKLETAFLWLVGIQFATLVAVLGSFIAR